MKFFNLLLKAATLWFRKGADQHAAALAYFMPFALTPLLLISITLVGLTIGSGAVLNLLRGWGNAIDPELTLLLETSVQNFDSLTTGYSIPLFATLFFSVMIVVAINSLTSGLHKLWGVEVDGWLSLLERAVRAVLFILLLQVYLVFTIMLNSTIAWLVAVSGVAALVSISPLLFLGSTIALFTFGYGLLPLQAPTLRARFYGATVAGVMFLFTREVVGFHITTAPIPNLFGAAGLIIVLLVWVYVAASIILYGAAFSKVYEDQRMVKVVTR